MSFTSLHFKKSYKEELFFIENRTQWLLLGVLILGLIFFPFFSTPFLLDLANQVFLALIGAIALMMLTGYAGQISLGHAGLIAAGAFTTAILFKEIRAPFWITLPASGLVGGILGFIFGLPSLRLKGLYLALSTLSLHFIVNYIGAEYETQRGFATGVVIEPPVLFSIIIEDPRAWYFLLLFFDVILIIFLINLLRSRTGRAWMAVRDRDIAAEALGIKLSSYKLSAFVTSSTITSIGGCLFAYYRGFVSAEAYSLFLTIEYIAMIIIGGIGSILGTIFGTIFVVLLPYVIEIMTKIFHFSPRITTFMFSINHIIFGLIMIIFLVFEPQGLVGIWSRIKNYFILWPFKYKISGIE